MYLVQLFVYPNTIGGAKKPEYQILFGIEKIRIPNTTTTIRSNYLNTDLFVTVTVTPCPVGSRHSLIKLDH